MMPAPAERTGIDGFGIASLVLGIAGLLPIPGLLSPSWRWCLAIYRDPGGAKRNRERRGSCLAGLE
jgi:hypothetical protein